MGFFDSLKDTGNLMKDTFVIIKKNKAILRPTITQVLLGMIFYLAVIGFCAVGYFATGGLQVAGILLMFVFMLLLLPLFPFIKMYYKAAQCWIVYNAFTGKNVTYKDGLARAKLNALDVFILGLFDIVLTALAKKLKQGTGKGGLFMIINIVLWILGKAVEEGWDLIGHYLLPAAIIEEKNVIEVLPEVKNIKKNVPGALAGVFGFDFAGDAIKSMFGSFMAFFIIAGVAIGFFVETWSPLVMIVAVLIGVNMLLSIFVEMIKTIYFTLFYVSITMPKKIVPEFRGEVTNYLLKKPKEK